ncbi:MAG TPA: helix-turn-helix transcriptional regulator [Pyrinomonadaceae bacterium]|jgi:transcriptional regulator with XRE-family HTH domain
MGRAARYIPERLGAKLHAIRLFLGLTQEEMIERLAYDKSLIRQGHISEYENGLREPQLLVILRYARVINATGLFSVTMEMLVDNEMDLPGELHGFVRMVEVAREADAK